MSAIAGRVLLIPKGAYDANVTYHMLDVVSYGGNSYVAKQTTAGNTPSADNAYWMLLSAGSAVASINDIGDVLITSPTNGQVLKYNAATQKWENGQDTGGLLPHLIIISEAGEDVVKAVKGSTEIIATETSTGHYECDVPEFGTWTIHAILNGDDATVNLVVDTVKVYTVDDSHFHADITVTYPSGGTCSCAKSGETTLYATGSPYTFTVHSAGAWTITATAYGKTFTQTVNISESGQTVYTSIPDGATITPTDDVQILLACAGIGDSQITTLAELLADTTTLSAVINSNNAVDYMVRSTTWATQITVPTMTSNTTPEGLAFAYGELSGYEAYKAFDNDDSTSWQGRPSAINGTIGYCFDSPVNISRVKYRDKYGNKQVTVSYSDNGTDYTVASDSAIITSGDTDYYFDTNVTSNHRYWRANITANESSNFYVSSLQFYSASIPTSATAMTYIGLNNYAANTLLADETWCNAICNSEYFESVLNVKVPTMTSATTPEGEVIGTFGETIGGQTYYGWKCFDGNDSTEGIGTSTSNQIIGYMFTSSMCLKKVHLVVDNYRRWNAGAKLQGSNDGNTWTDIYTTDSVVTGTIDLNISNHTSYLGYRFANLNASVNPSVQTIQFYGREDV